MSRLIFTSLFLCLACLSCEVVAGGSSIEARIRHAVVQALGGAIAPGDVALGPALSVTECATPLVAVAQGIRNVEVRCEDQPGWKIYVPVVIEQVAAVVVMAKPGRAGAPLRADQVTIQKRDLASVRGEGFASPSAVIGKVLRRGLPPGAVVLASHVAGGVMLKRGDPVTIESTLAGISVRMGGRAMGSATLGGLVNVENVTTRRIVRGRLVEEGVVQIGP